MDFFSLFDHVYILHLPHRRDRERLVCAQLNRHGLSFNCQTALFPGTIPKSAGEFPSVGARGCFLGHLSLLKDALKKGYTSILVLEDDVGFSHSFSPREPAFIESVQNFPPWGTIYFGHQSNEAIEPGLHRYRGSGVGLTNHFLAHSSQVFSPLIQFLEEILQRRQGDPAGGPMHIDGAFTFFYATHPEYTRWIHTPSLAIQQSSASDIAAKRWFDQFGPTKWAVNRARSLKNHFRLKR